MHVHCLDGAGFMDHPKTRMQHVFPPITQHLCFSPEWSLTPPPVTQGQTFSVTFDTDTESFTAAPRVLNTASATVVVPETNASDMENKMKKMSKTPVRSILKDSPHTAMGSGGAGANKRIRIHPPLEMEGTSVSEDKLEEHTGVTSDRCIPKPKGEVGHPRTNGYSLFLTLDWEQTEYKIVQRGVQQLADAILDTSLGISKQDPNLVFDLLHFASKKFKILCNYIEYWPARDMVKQYLKNTADKACKDRAMLIAAHKWVSRHSKSVILQESNDS
ncbi:hypothetical protein K439DRAFT_1661738 [Ramaria rubella]|nr:hypothetical protein K439DRAFT_1661738 [Ramaria rubella]